MKRMLTLCSRVSVVFLFDSAHLLKKVNSFLVWLRKVPNTK